MPKTPGLDQVALSPCVQTLNECIKNLDENKKMR
jgi:hypothetical protein